MAQFEELKALVKKKGFGSLQINNINGEPVYFSRGIREIFLASPEEEQKIIAVVSRFQKQDYGNAAEYGKESRPGHEYGRYDIADFDETQEDTGVWLHRAEDAVKVYFNFER